MESERQARQFDPSEFSSIVACSRLLTLLGFAFYRTHRANDITLGDAAAWTWLHLLRGVKIVYDTILKSGAEIDPILSLNMKPQIASHMDLRDTPDNGMQWHREHAHFHLIQDTRKERFDSLFGSLLSREANFTPKEANDLHDTILSLKNVTEHICTGEVHSLNRALATWPGNMSAGFTDMLLRNEPFALVLYAHWLMLGVLAEDMWWVGDMGVAGIREVASICLRDDQKLQPLLEWPMQMLKTDD